MLCFRGQFAHFQITTAPKYLQTQREVYSQVFVHVDDHAIVIVVASAAALATRNKITHETRQLDNKRTKSETRFNHKGET